MEKDMKPAGLCDETNEFLEEVYDEEGCSGCEWESICRKELGLND